MFWFSIVILFFVFLLVHLCTLFLLHCRHFAKPQHGGLGDVSPVISVVLFPLYSRRYSTCAVVFCL